MACLLSSRWLSYAAATQGSAHVGFQSKLSANPIDFAFPGYPGSPPHPCSELLRGLVMVYLHVESIDRANPGPEGPVFAAAVGQDSRSFDAAYFDEVRGSVHSKRCRGARDGWWGALREECLLW